ncbi:MAG TPA: tRNA (adenosine(37)-N6)-threonylcarbamoyltransferase complex ATPase subunit type 1 TsaE [Gemmatimonadaceae bacterium]|nr:tRNA (adenosine(37)-N6)-threonylcarbamoyltransferase complex ATPase subunit type 1 TsaE [Gemmatimonadaceae bacterium]
MTFTPRYVVPPLAGEGHLTLDERELRRWGQDLGEASNPPLLIALTGELGTGKTTLAQAICMGYGVEELVTSPSYALVHRYEAPRSQVYHLDLYRLDNEAQLTNIGWDDILSERALVIVEWAERAAGRMPSNHLHIELEYSPAESSRRILLAG